MTDKLRQAAQQILEAATDLTILTPREWQAVHGLKINALRDALAEPQAEQEPVAWMCADDRLVSAGYDRFSAVKSGDWNIPVYTDPQPAIPPGYKLVPVSLLEDLAPADPVNDDETGGCVFCGGRPAGKPFGDASSDPSDHRPGCPWLKIRALLSGTAPQPAERERLTDDEILHALMLDPPEPSLWPHLKDDSVIGDVQRGVIAIAHAVIAAYEAKNGITKE